MSVGGFAMNHHLHTPLALVLLLLLASLVLADTQPLDTLTTKDGMTYHKVTVRQFAGDSVVLFHSSGILTTTLGNIPNDARKALVLPSDEELEAARKVREDFERQQREKGLVNDGNKWITQGEKDRRVAERARIEKEKAAIQARLELDKKAETLVKDKTITDVHFRVFQALPDGSLCKSTAGDIFFLYDASNRIVADGDRFKGNLYWAGTYVYQSTGGIARTVNSYAVTLEDAREIVKIKFDMTNSSKPTSQGENPAPGIKGSGTGFAITADGYILTCFHVVKGAASLSVKINAASDLLPAKVIGSDPANDLAILKVSGETVAVSFSSAPTAKLGQTIFTVGFPMPDLQGFAPKVTKGVISSLKGMNDDVRRYQIDATVQPGNSGGPLADEHGNILGVIVARLSDAVVIKEKGVVPQNINYAVKVPYIMAFLSNVPEVSAKVEQAKDNAPIPFEDAVERIRKATVLIVVK
jgi:S1-C subfamily serine protease